MLLAAAKLCNISTRSNRKGTCLHRLLLARLAQLEAGDLGGLAIRARLVQHLPADKEEPWTLHARSAAALVRRPRHMRNFLPPAGAPYLQPQRMWMRAGHAMPASHQPGPSSTPQQRPPPAAPARVDAPALGLDVVGNGRQQPLGRGACKGEVRVEKPGLEQLNVCGNGRRQLFPVATSNSHTAALD